MGKKGQSSLEFISTYGWALLIVALALVVMWQLGFFDPFSRELPGKSGFSIVTPVEWKCDGSMLSMTITSTATISNLSVVGVQCNPQQIEPGDYSACSLSVECPEPGKAFRELVVITYTANSVPHQSAGILWGSAQ